MIAQPRLSNAICTQEFSDISLTVAIPSIRSPERVLALLGMLASGNTDAAANSINVAIARPQDNTLPQAALRSLPGGLPVRQLPCARSHATAMRNALLDTIDSSHVLFLDDDMVPAPGLYDAASARARMAPEAVHQGPPYLVANPENWFARMEARLYAESYHAYVSGDAVSILDARLLLAPTEALRRVRFDESFHYAGEGRQLALALLQEGLPLLLAPELIAYHMNRDSLRGVCQQKRSHGWGRAHTLRTNGPGQGGWVGYFGKYMARHYLLPIKSFFTNGLTAEDVLYQYLTNTVFWMGVLEGMIRRSET